MIESDEQLAVAAQAASELIQQISDYLGERNCEEGKIRFPRGYIRACIEHRNKYTFIKDPVLRRNIAYALLTTDVFRWLLNRTDLAIVAKEMIIKQGIAIFGSIAEAVTKDYLKGKPGGGKNYKKRLDMLYENGEIDEETKRELVWLWDLRNSLHLMLLTDPEYEKYTMRDYNRAVLALRRLRICLGGEP